MGCSSSTPRASSTSTASTHNSQPQSRIAGLRSLRTNSSAQPQPHQHQQQQQQPPPPQHQTQRPLRLPRSYHNSAANPTHALWTPASLARERRIFFETRVSGAPEIWQAVRLAVEMIREARDVGGAQSVLEAAGVSVPRGRLEDGAWDERGVLYALPEWVLGDPIGIVVVGGGGDEGCERDDDEVGGFEDEEEDGDDVKEVFDGGAAAGEGGDAGRGEVLRIRARLSDRGTDVVLSLGREQSVNALAKAVREAADIPGKTKVKIAYLGRILKDNQSLSKQGWQQGHVVNALVFA